MGKYFLTSVSFSSLNEKGVRKTVTEDYLIFAESVSDAEYIVTNSGVAPAVDGLLVSGCKKANFAEVLFGEDCEKWYSAKVLMYVYDEKTNTEKRKTINYLIGAYSFENAYDKLKHELSGSVSDIEIAAIAATKIVEVYKEKEDALQN